MLHPYWKLPKIMQNDIVGKYYNFLNEKLAYFFIKRVMDIVMSLVLIIILMPVMVIIYISIAITGEEPIFRQIRITQYMRPFVIYKFRTMSNGENGGDITKIGDERITPIGKFLRRTRLDEIPQLVNIIQGDMSFVGVRPEVPSFVARYSQEMLATFLMPAGLTSWTSIAYKNEGEMLEKEEDYDSGYIEKILPQKMKMNLMYLASCGIREDIRVIIKTVMVIVGR